MNNTLLHPRLFLLMLGLLTLGGCSLFGPQNVPEVSTYTLAVQRVHSHSPSTHKTTLLVNTPTATAGYDSRKMIFTNKPYELGQFARSQWTAPPGEMLEPMLIQKLRDTGYFHAVVSNAYTTNRQLMLRTHLIELRQDFTVKPSQLRLAIQAELVNSDDNKVINSQTFTIAMPAYENTPYSGVVAANKAVDRLLTQIAQFSLKSLQGTQHATTKTKIKYRFHKKKQVSKIVN